MLELLVFIMMAAAVYKFSAVAFIYVSLIYIHDIYFGYLIQDSYQLFIIWAGVLTIISLFACYYFRQNAKDTIAYYLFIVCLLTLFVNIIAIYVATHAINMEFLYYLYAAINLLSIAAIVKGDSGGQRWRVPALHYYAHPSSSEMGHDGGRVAHREKRSCPKR